MVNSVRRGITVPVSIVLMVPLVLVLVALAFMVLQSQVREPESRLVETRLLGVEGTIAKLLVVNQATHTITHCRIQSLPSQTIVFDREVEVKPREAITVSIPVPVGDNQLNITYTFNDGKQVYDIVVLG